MKHQYFGDTRDLFKYDLILRIMEGIPSIRSFTFVPMLTPDDKSSDGREIDLPKARAGLLNVPLALHLAECVREGRRNVCEILPFFTAYGIPVNLHGEVFTRKERAAYFRAIPDAWLRDALVFLDPDIGMEVRNSTEKHLLFSEIQSLYDRMDSGSILLLFQFIPRVKRDAYVKRRTAELSRKARGRILSITDNQIVFFFLGRDIGVTKKLQEILVRYHGDYPDLTLSV